MKKVILSLAVLATVALVSCDSKKGNDSESAAAPAATEEVTTVDESANAAEVVVAESGVQAAVEEAAPAEPAK